MSRRIAFLLLALVNIHIVYSQNAVLRGAVHDDDGRPLEGVHAYIEAQQRGTVTNSRGHYFLGGLEEGQMHVRFSHIGYASEQRRIKLRSGDSVSISVQMTARLLDMGDVTITGTRSHELQRESPFPVSVVGSEQLIRSAPVSVSDALDAEPGIALLRDGVWGTDVSIRGLSRANVVTLVDGARIETATNLAAGLSLVDVTDVDRVEVIRSGASSMYGTGATGGVVNVVTRNGTYSNAFRLSGGFNSSYTSVNNGSGAALTVDASDSRWYLHLHGGMRGAEDARTPDGVLRDSRFHDRSMNLSAGVRPFGTHEMRLRYQRVRAEDVGIPGGAAFPEQASARYPDEDRELLMAEYDSGPLGTRLRGLSLQVFRQIIGRNVELIPNAAVVVRPSADHVMNGLQAQSIWHFGAHRLTVGVDGWQRSYSGIRLREVRATNTVIADLPLPDARFRSLGLYAQDDVSLNAQRLRLTVGGRIDQIHVENDESYDLQYIERDGERNTSPPGRMLRWPAEESDEISWSAHAGLLYHLTDAIDLTANAARSFRAPSLEERFQFIELGGAAYVGDVDLAAEKGTFLDAGIRLRDDDFTLRANAFLRLMGDLVVDARVNDTLYRKSNVGEARLYGAELTGEFRLADGFIGYASAALVRGEDTGAGTDLPQMPPLSGRAGLRLAMLPAVTVDLSADLTADQEHTAPGEIRTPGSMRVNLRLRSDQLRFGSVGFSLSGGVENLFDRAWRRHLSTLRGLIVSEPGRNIYIRMRVLW